MTTPDPAEPDSVDDAVEDSLIDALREDAGKLDEYPPGVPELVPFLELRPRSRRARFKRKLAECTALEDTVKDVQRRAKKLATTKVTPELQKLRMQLSADVDDLFGLMDEVLEIAAVDDVKWRTWSDGLGSDDNDLARVFQLYMQRSQPGEASSSAS